VDTTREDTEAMAATGAMITVDTEGMGITVMADMADTGGTMITVMAQATMAITRRARVRRGQEPAREAAGAAPTVLSGGIRGTTTAQAAGITGMRTSTLQPRPPHTPRPTLQLVSTATAKQSVQTLVSVLCEKHPPVGTRQDPSSSTTTLEKSTVCKPVPEYEWGVKII